MSATSSSAGPPRPNPSVPGAPGTIPPAPIQNNATTSSDTLSVPLISPSLRSTGSRPRPSNSASASRSTTSAPTTMTATASTATGGRAHGATDPNPSQPSRTTQLHIAEARTALVASMSNMLDSELQSRASLLHSNAAALAKQEKDVIRGTEALRKENDKLEKLARDTERKIKELGNVQNWAEVLERDFLVLEETMRLVKEGSGSDSCSECSRSSWSGSYSADNSRAGSRRGSVTGEADDGARKSEGPRVNGHIATDGDARAAPLQGKSDVNVTVDKEVAASISEAMATALVEPLESLLLDPVPASTRDSSLKGKAPATEDSGIEVDNAPDTSPPELTRPSDIPRSESTDEDMATDKNIIPSAETG